MGNVSGEAKELIQSYDLGYAIDPGNPKKLAELAKKLSCLGQSRYNEVSQNCLRLYDKKFRKENLFEEFVKEINNLFNEYNS